MISVDEALSALFDLVSPLGTERVPLREASGRVLAEAVTASRDQPPFAASAMDGYALRGDDARPGASFRIVGEASAGSRFSGIVGRGEAVRIFTGAPVPEGADRVVIQEDARRDGSTITLGHAIDNGPHVRPAAADFSAGDRLSAPRRLLPAEVALAAAMNAPEVTVFRRPEVALIATGDELVMPGETPGRDQIVASNAFGLAAMIEAEGGRARLLPVARDETEALATVLDLARGADLIVTIGGASVGDRDLVDRAATSLGMERRFHRVRMRPGKPLLSGRLSGTPLVGLPGNPVSAMVCGHVFIRPMLRAMQGLGAHPMPRETAVLARPLGPNGGREHYMRARREAGGVTAFERQDSALLSVFAAADCLIRRAPGDPARAADDIVEILPL